LADQVELPPLSAGGLLNRAEIGDRLFEVVDARALVGGGQEAGAPQGRVLAALLNGDEAR
jgi:hypothetical protein